MACHHHNTSNPLISKAECVLPVCAYQLSHFPPFHLQLFYPFFVANCVGDYDIECDVRGGGITGQSEALQVAVARAIAAWNPATRELLEFSLCYRLLMFDSPYPLLQTTCCSSISARSNERRPANMVHVASSSGSSVDSSCASSCVHPSFCIYLYCVLMQKTCFFREQVKRSVVFWRTDEHLRI